MAEGDDHGGSSLGSFSSFWQKVGIGKGSSAKDVKFMTNVTKPGPGAGNGEFDSSFHLISCVLYVPLVLFRIWRGAEDWRIP
jgi:hypothetical protein